MFNSLRLKQWGLTPAKMALIAILAVVLVVVVAVQLPGAAGPEPVVATPPRPVRKAVPVRTEPATTTSPTIANAGVAATPLPQIPIADIVRHNPFRLPAHLRPSLPDNSTKPTDPQNQHILQELISSQSGIVLMVGGEHVARIGATTIRVGDKFGQYRVSKIDAAGVVLVDESGDSN